MSNEIDDYNRGKIDAFYEVGSALRYEYEGAYNQSEIEDFFYIKANELNSNKQDKG